MDRRFLLALVLTGAVLVGTPFLFPTPTPPARPAGAPKTDSSATAPAPAAAPSAATTTPAAMSATPSAAAPAIAAVPVETVTVVQPAATTRYSTRGASPLDVTLARFQSLGAQRGSAARIGLPGSPMLRYRIIAAGDTIDFGGADFVPTATTNGVSFVGRVGAAELQVSYTAGAVDYLTDVRLSATGVTAPAFLLVDLPRGFATQEADSTDDYNHLAYAVNTTRGDATGIAFTKLDGGERRLEAGPLSWVVAKNKYFLVGLLAPTSGTPFAEAHIIGEPRAKKATTRGNATAVLPLNGKVHFELYAGPQEWKRLVALGRNFENTNPYGGWLQGVVQPFATIVMSVLLWMKERLGFGYGWVLVIFGVAIRLILWPLNQGAMRTSIKMQRLQPELQAIQTKYKSDPQKQQQEILRVYKEHGMSPFSAFSGCLPMLLPMPILFALFWVFQNTIEFRGVPFLWLTDISLHDPLYILPLLMGASMYLLSWIGMRNAPPNPQAKMMSYLFPVMMTFFLLKMAAGLNLYYAIQNLAALPQQWMLAHERAKQNKG